MSLIDPRGILESLLDRVIGWIVLVSVGCSLAVAALWVVLTYWLLFVGIAVGFAIGWVAHSRHGW